MAVEMQTSSSLILKKQKAEGMLQMNNKFSKQKSVPDYNSEEEENTVLKYTVIYF